MAVAPFEAVVGLFSVVQKVKASQSEQACHHWLVSGNGSYVAEDEADAADSRTGDTDVC